MLHKRISKRNPKLRSARRTDDDRPGADGGGRYHDGFIGRRSARLWIVRMRMVRQEDGGTNRTGTNGSAGKSDALENRSTNSLAVTAIDTHLESLLRESAVQCYRDLGQIGNCDQRGAVLSNSHSLAMFASIRRASSLGEQVGLGVRPRLIFYIIGP
jgi:hypothetical protein